MSRLAPRTAPVLLLVALSLPARGAESTGPTTIAGKAVVLDQNGLLRSWLPQPQAYARVSRDAWKSLLTARTEKNGRPAYYAWPEYDVLTGDPYDWVHNPAGLFAMLTDSGLRMWAFDGDPTSLQLVAGVLDHVLAQGLTGAHDLWPRVPYASSSPGELVYQGADDDWACGGCGSGDGLGVIEPDKVGELGFAFARFHEATGDLRYLDEAIACADALAANQRDGDAERSPWPMRVFAATGEVREEYSANVLGPIRLFDELVRNGWGRVDAYRHARDAAWAWLLAVPMENGNWSGYFEDVPIQDSPDANRNQLVPLMTARWLLEHPELDPDWRAHAARLIAFAEDVFGADTDAEPGLQWGALTMSEQEAVFVKMGSHTARYGAVKALWSAVTGDANARDRAFRSLNWATYLSDGQGHVQVVNAPVEDASLSWFSDGYGDYVRHFLAAMGSVPEWAPPGEDHLLDSTSVVVAVQYGPSHVGWRTFDRSGTEVLRLSRVPVAVWADGRALPPGDGTGPGWTVRALDGTDVALTVRRAGASTVVLDFDAAQPGQTFEISAPPPPSHPGAASGCGAAPGTASPAVLWLTGGLLALGARGAARRRRAR